MKKANQTIIYSYPDTHLGIQTSGIQEGRHIKLFHDDWLLSPMFDSEHEGMLWDRLFLTIPYGQVQCLIWCFDTAFDLADVQLSKDRASIVSNACHILLKQAKGRYLRFVILYQGDEHAVFNGYECSFPYRTHLELLPQYYQNNEALHLLFAPIEDVFLSLQSQIRTQHHMFDVTYGSEAQLKALLALLDLKAFDVFPIEVIRAVLENRHTWMKQRGTIPALIKLATMLLQRNVVVKVQHPHITITACFHHEEEAITVTSTLEHEIPCGTTLHMKWLTDAALDSAYFDLGLSLNQGVPSRDIQLDTGVYVWE